MSDTTETLERTPAFPVDCEATVRALWDYLDSRLDALTMAAIDVHLAECEKCRGHFAFEGALLDRLHSLRREHDDVEALRRRVVAALRSGGNLPG